MKAAQNTQMITAAWDVLQTRDHNQAGYSHRPRGYAQRNLNTSALSDYFQFTVFFCEQCRFSFQMFMSMCYK